MNGHPVLYPCVFIRTAGTLNPGPGELQNPLGFFCFLKIINGLTPKTPDEQSTEEQQNPADPAALQDQAWGPLAPIQASFRSISTSNHVHFSPWLPELDELIVF